MFIFISNLKDLGWKPANIMELITLIDSDGKEKKTTKTAWNHAPEQKRLKVQGWKLKPETPLPGTEPLTTKQLEERSAQAAVASGSGESIVETKPKKSQKNG